MFALEILSTTVTTIWLIIGILIWLALAFWPARVASRKGYSFLLFFLLSIIFSFLLILIIAYIMPRRNTPAPPPAEPAA